MDAVVYPTDFGMPRKGRRMSRQAFAAVGLSLAVHVVVIGYIANEKFKDIQQQVPFDRKVDVTTYTLPKDPPPPSKDLHQPPKPITVHVPDSVIPPLDQHVDPLPTVIVPPTASEGPPQVIAQTQPPPFVQLADNRPLPPKDRLIRNPSWLRKPSGSEMERIYPRRAMELEKSGGATLMCTVAASGSVGGCSVIDESPKGLGFGEAAIAATKFFKLNPRTVDGDVVEGAKVRIPLVFNLAN